MSERRGAGYATIARFFGRIGSAPAPEAAPVTDERLREALVLLHGAALDYLDGAYADETDDGEFADLEDALRAACRGARALIDVRPAIS